ncbi:hypothetical protein [Bradyrhizobium yuanmingense]|uniref:hypothetical protein n=1 Tax=Bradyrhizobium yuanmingense TaxID=108015 RepID=UPI000B22DF9A|nr:hypothetical protein [Bradyrhizobium yuanmingense]
MNGVLYFFGPIATLMRQRNHDRDWTDFRNEIARRDSSSIACRSKLGDEPAMKAMKDFVTRGGATRSSKLRELGCFQQFEPFARLAEETKSAIPGKTS